MDYLTSERSTTHVTMVQDIDLRRYDIGCVARHFLLIIHHVSMYYAADWEF
jgi:hypothetical protein